MALEKDAEHRLVTRYFGVLTKRSQLDPPLIRDKELGLDTHCVVAAICSLAACD